MTGWVRRARRVTRDSSQAERRARRGEIVHASRSWEQAAGEEPVAPSSLRSSPDSVADLHRVSGTTDGRRQPGAVRFEARRRRARDVVEGPTSAAVHARRRRRGEIVTDHDDRSEAASTRHDDSLPWHELSRCDAVYFCAGDAEPSSPARARARRRRARAGDAAQVAVGSTLCSSEGRSGAVPDPATSIRSRARR
jgi:hypothetical protein